MQTEFPAFGEMGFHDKFRNFSYHRDKCVFAYYGLDWKVTDKEDTKKQGECIYFFLTREK
jgi:hypothetical protein